MSPTQDEKSDSKSLGKRISALFTGNTPDQSEPTPTPTTPGQTARPAPESESETKTRDKKPWYKRAISPDWPDEPFDTDYGPSQRYAVGVLSGPVGLPPDAKVDPRYKEAPKP